MYCWYCGTKLPGAAAFCYRCGQSQDESAAYDPDAKPLAPDGWPWSPSRPTEEGPAPTTNSNDEPTGPASPPLTVVVEVPESAGARSPAARSDGDGLVPPPSRVAGVLGIVCGLLVVAGSLGPWVTTRIVPRDPIAIHGIEGDGRFTLWCGLAAVICLVAQIAAPRRIGFGVVAAGAFFLAALIGVADWTNVSDHLGRLGPSTPLEAEISWGLRAVTIGGLLGSVLAAAQAVQSRRIARHS